MPLYEFHCPDCDTTFEELLRRVDEASEVQCPRCGSERVERLPSGFSTVSSGGSPVSTSDSGCSPRGGFT